MGNRTVNPGT